jgi:GT2 family glycosyltransferase
MSNTKPARLMIVVLYRLKVGESPTLQSLERCKGALDAQDQVVIWDNSPSPQDGEDLSRMQAALPCGLHYRHTPENISLAAIYNRAVSEHPAAELVFLLDQDSAFTPDFFREINEAAAAHPEINLFVPLIKHGRQVVSPGHYYAFKGKYWTVEKYGVVPARSTVAIASGMCIRMAYLQRFGGFEEKLKLYGIDTNFMIRYSRDNADFYVLRAPFGHALSDFSSEERLVKQARFADFRRASLVNAKLFPLHVQLLSRFFLWYKSLRS